MCAYLALHVLCINVVQDGCVGKHVAQAASSNCQVMTCPLVSPTACACLLMVFVQVSHEYDRQSMQSVARAARDDLVHKLVARLALGRV